MSELNPLAPLITQWAIVVQKAMEEVAKIRAKRQVNNVLSQQNSPDTTLIHGLPLNSEVLV